MNKNIAIVILIMNLFILIFAIGNYLRTANKVKSYNVGTYNTSVKFTDTVPKRKSDDPRWLQPKPARPQAFYFDSTSIPVGSSFSITDTNYVVESITMHFPDSSIEIEGDTMKLLKTLYTEYIKCSNKLKNQTYGNHNTSTKNRRKSRKKIAN